MPVLSVSLQQTQEHQARLYPDPAPHMPEGVARTYCHADVLTLIEQAIPPSIGGQKVFAHLLSYATLSPHTGGSHGPDQAPDTLDVPGPYSDEAVIVIKSIEALARTEQSPCKPETYHKVLLACEAMQILERRFHRTWTEIRIPLRKRPPALPVLLQGLALMQERYANQKFRRFARRVARRLQAGESVPSPLHASSNVSLWQLLVDLLHAHGVATIRPKELAQACERIAQVCVGQSATGESEAPGEFHVTDSPMTSELASPDSPHESDSPTEQCPCQQQTRQFDEQIGESDASDGADSPALPDSPAFCALSGESLAPLSFIDSHPLQVFTEKEMTINVMTVTDSPNSPACGSPALSTDITSPDPSITGSTPYADARPFEEIRHEAAALAERLDGSRTCRWLGTLIACVQHYPPHVRRLAEIDTLYHSVFPDYRGKPQKPGAWFLKRCATYADPHVMVSEEIGRWHSSGLSLQDIHEQLARGRRVPAALSICADEHLSQQPGWVPTVTVHRFDANQQGILQTSMNRVQAEQLCVQVRREGADLGIRAEVLPGKDQGTFIVATAWDGVEEAWANAAEWNRYFPQARACYTSYRSLAA